MQNIGRGGKANMTFTVPRDDVYRAEKAVKDAFSSTDEIEFIASDIAKISVVGIGMKSHSGVAARFFDALATSGISIQLISTSEIKISVGIDLDKAEDAVRAAHDAFQLGS
ncbi:MAG: ACT domain-containing protein [Verrucomicrobiota bacterium]